MEITTNLGDKHLEENLEALKEFRESRVFDYSDEVIGNIHDNPELLEVKENG